MHVVRIVSRKIRMGLEWIYLYFGHGLKEGVSHTHISGCRSNTEEYVRVAREYKLWE